jgi:hypothetical protein
MTKVGRAVLVPTGKGRSKKLVAIRDYFFGLEANSA